MPAVFPAYSSLFSVLMRLALAVLTDAALLRSRLAQPDATAAETGRASSGGAARAALRFLYERCKTIMAHATRATDQHVQQAVAKRTQQLTSAAPSAQPASTTEGAAAAEKCAFCGTVAALNADGARQRLARCARCLRVAYCDKQCQTLHWKHSHKSACAGGLSASSSSDR
jgi:hypothetical protein